MAKIFLFVISSALVQVQGALQYFYDNTNNGGKTPGANIVDVKIGGLSDCVLVYFGGPSIPNDVLLTISSVVLSMSSFPNLDIKLCAQNGNPNPALYGDCGTLFPNEVAYQPPFTSSSSSYVQYVLDSPVPLLSGSPISIKMCSSSTTAPTAY